MSDIREGLAERAGNSLEAKKPPTLVSMIADQTQAVERALPAHLKGQGAAFVRAAQTLVRGTPALARCEPATVLGGLLTASALGLEFGPLGHCYLVPYGSKAQFILGYRGITDLAWRSGKLVSIEAREVKANDEFEFSYGLDPKLVHKPYMEGDRGASIAYYGVAHFKGGGSYFVVMSRADVDEHRKSSKSSKSGPWVDHYDAMARKTVIRVMSPYLPLTTEVERAIAQDGVVASGTDRSNLEVETPDYDEDTGEIVDAEVVA